MHQLDFLNTRCSPEARTQLNTYMSEYGYAIGIDIEIKARLLAVGEVVDIIQVEKAHESVMRRKNAVLWVKLGDVIGGACVGVFAASAYEAVTPSVTSVGDVFPPTYDFSLVSVTFLVAGIFIIIALYLYSNNSL